MPKKNRIQLFISDDVERALDEYARVHGDRYDNRSQVADHLLRRALLDQLGEDLEAVMLTGIRSSVVEGIQSLLPAIRQLVCEEVQVATGRLQTVLASPAWDGATERRTPLGANVGSGQ